MSLRTRLAALVALIVLTASTVGGIGVALSSRNIGRNQVDSELRSDAAELDMTNQRFAAQLTFMLELRRSTCADADNAEGDTTAGDEQSDPLDRTPGGRRTAIDRLGPLVDDFASSMQVILINGATIAECRVLPVDEAERAVAAQESGSAIRTVSIDGDRYRMLTTGVPGVGAVQIARDLDLTESTLRGLFVRIIGFGMIGALVAGLLGWFLARRTTVPIERLNDAATRVAATQDLGERITVEGTDEVSALATSFNTMLESLDTSREQQRRLVQDASHELRTPLTSMRTNVELLQRHRNVDPELRAQVLDDISVELGELTELTSELVDSATEVTHHVEQAIAFDLGALVADCVQRAERRHRRDIGHETSQAASTIHGDPNLIARAVTNLINNAAKFCQAPGAITVTASGTSVSVSDDGPGIPDGDLPHIFERFYRSTTARSAPGSGLGLAIVKQIVDGHGGTVSAHNKIAGGLEIGFSLPNSATAAPAPDA